MKKNYVVPPLTKPESSGLSDYLKTSISAFANISEIPVTFFDKNDNVEMEFYSEAKICNYFDVYTDRESICRGSLKSSAGFAAKLGEPYIFVCKAGLVLIAVVLIVDGEYLGCFMAGPIIMGSLRESTISKFMSMNNISESLHVKLTMNLSKMRVHEAERVSLLAIILNNCVIASTNSENEYASRSRISREQNKMGIDLQRYKQENKKMNYPHELESKLIKYIKDHDIAKSEEVLKTLLKEMYLLESSDISAVKSEVMGLFAIILRTVSYNQIAYVEFMDSGFNIIYEFENVKDFEQLEAKSISLLEKISTFIFSAVYKGNSDIVRRAIIYIADKYCENVNLKVIAEYLNVNPSYFSMLFKQEMKIPFTEYVNNLRLERAKNLLMTSTNNITEISGDCGFESQSYFTKLFKAKEGVSPGDYRKNQSKS